MAATFTLVDGNVRRKHKPLVTVRYMTLDEIKALRGHADFIANDGTLRECKINGAVQRWKRSLVCCDTCHTSRTRATGLQEDRCLMCGNQLIVKDRVEVPVKYGLYEFARFDADEALRRFVVRL